MIAKYNGIYCNIDLSKTPVEIWVYKPVEGFKKGVTRRGTVFYEKQLSIDDLEQIFDVGFSVCWDSQWCGIYYNVDNDLLSLHTNNYDFAETHGMREFERGVFSCALPASSFNEYRMYTMEIDGISKTYAMVSYEEFKILWKEMIADLIPPRINN